MDDAVSTIEVPEPNVVMVDDPRFPPSHPVGVSPPVTCSFGLSAFCLTLIKYSYFPLMVIH